MVLIQPGLGEAMHHCGVWSKSLRSKSCLLVSVFERRGGEQDRIHCTVRADKWICLCERVTNTIQSEKFVADMVGVTATTSADTVNTN